MHAFKERAEAFGWQFARREEEAFRQRVRADREIGMWAAGEMGLDHESAKAYAESLVQADLLRTTPDAIFDRLRADFAASGLPHSEAWLRRQMLQTHRDAE